MVLRKNWVCSRPQGFAGKGKISIKVPAGVIKIINVKVK